MRDGSAGERERVEEEMRRMDAALSETENELCVMFDIAPVGIIQTDPRTQRITRVNAAMSTITGYAAEELLSMRVADITHPDDHATDAESFGRAVRGEPTEPRGEKRYVRKDGGVVWVNVNFRLLRDARGQVTRAMAIVEDVTERRARDAALRLQTNALQAAANGIVITDTQGKVQWVNDAFTRLTGYPAAEILGGRLGVLRSGAQGDTFYRALWQTILEGRTWRGELVNRRKDGSLYNEEMTITPVRDEGGKVAHFIAIKHDITQQRETEEQLRSAQRMEAIGRLAGGVAHDFNNLLSVIISYSELAGEALRDGDPLRADLLEISGAAHRAAGLTRQLLAFSRRQVLAPEPVNLGTLLEGVSKMLQRLIGEDVVLHVDAADGLFMTKVDRGQTEQVVMNLAVNARDAMPEGGDLRIHVSNAKLDAERAAALELPPGPYVELCVADSGSGMTPEVRARIFEPFFTTKPVGKGTGLGLSTVHGIVKQSHGGISVETAPGRGTTFHVFFPRHVAGNAEEHRSVAPGPRREARGNETILVVDDEGALGNVVKRVLASAGYRVFVAANPGEALLFCEENGRTLDLLLTDVVMPGMSGRKLATRLAPLCPSARVMFMSGYTDELLEQHDVLGQRFLRKPFDLETLTAEVRSVLDEPVPGHPVICPGQG